MACCFAFLSKPHGRGRKEPVEDSPALPERTVLQRDALEWLRALGPKGLPKCSVVTSLPDWSELKKGTEMPLPKYLEWFREALRLIFAACKEETLVVFLQTDICSEGRWINKAQLIGQEAQTFGAALLWHKITFDPEMVGVDRRGASADFSHLLCFQVGGVVNFRCAVPDLLPRGRKVYAQGMGTHAMGLVLAWLKQAQPGLDLVVDPFCGRGTVLALSNGLGLRALGLELDAGCARSARRLDLAKLAEHGDQPVAFYLQRAREGREKKRRNAE